MDARNPVDSREGSACSKGDACSLLVRFNPQGTGRRLGFLNIFHSAEATPMSRGLIGNSYAPGISFTPSQIIPVPGTESGSTGTIGSSTNLAIDGGDTLYIAGIGNDLFKEIDSTGVIRTVTPAFDTPASLAVDSIGIVYTAAVAGNLDYFSFYFPWGTETAYALASATGTCTPSARCDFAID